MTFRNILVFLAINAVGIALFLLVASAFWSELEVGDIPGASLGNAFGWFVFAVPIAVIFLFCDLLWLVLAAIEADWPDRLRYVVISLAVLATWAAAYAFDNAHHGL